MSQPALQPDVQRVGDLDCDNVAAFLGRFGLTVAWIPDGADITASYWGEPEAGIAGCCVYLRDDTPVHSMLHEVCHVICMTSDRREHLNRDAGGDDLEESAVCYLQIILADYLDGVGRARLMRDMDAWGYSFRLGSTARWFSDDADDASQWLQTHKLLGATKLPQFQLRGTQ